MVWPTSLIVNLLLPSPSISNVEGGKESDLTYNSMQQKSDYNKNEIRL